MAINFEKGGKVTTLGGQDPKVKMPTAPQRGRKLTLPAFRPIDLQNLEESRGKFVLQCRANPRGWPDGIGAWFKDEDWDRDGKLVVVGEAKTRAVDPWANDRAKGRPCPPLPKVDGFDPVRQPKAHVRQTEPPVRQAANAVRQQFDKKEYQRNLMREKRAAKKLGLTIAEYRAQQPKP
jgi:hypothetical protein